MISANFIKYNYTILKQVYYLPLYLDKQNNEYWNNVQSVDIRIWKYVS